uniref:MalT-like TPR region domain-containing protein n=1 Tax=Corethron hystrix TaxID=216773 RepID=A0A7S1BI52_9STRA|mmetsp:Transcript_27417/g.62957  ORF Transcript_27417/g.62957 Transcript_27417/m.62957 type:complete len:754 (+) Transcript_27417:532-2793(+)|eukprot:CAMPEP_0113297694 /NCGR_PEP_ID=MMETSP0010_2-20120614/451_1 /TAXON_ID=216773 ORGANISM="Corethron hystrix, Strain 308" /NCGR_SAMPLE_ID=MMETSP0010_2 /ASSEMBLY_ACC=CAM_ASM_000155 /LENGTH=753 /DNA_ID=CAMNT_0000150629 /DNA_START=407 /DNA_END=2671 /DNA_ORIENTATION=+ /assembly_acc=CAM_ASM_000155
MLRRFARRLRRRRREEQPLPSSAPVSGEVAGLRALVEALSRAQVEAGLDGRGTSADDDSTGGELADDDSSVVDFLDEDSGDSSDGPEWQLNTIPEEASEDLNDTVNNDAVNDDTASYTLNGTANDTANETFFSSTELVENYDMDLEQSLLLEPELQYENRRLLDEYSIEATSVPKLVTSPEPKLQDVNRKLLDEYPIEAASVPKLVKSPDTLSTRDETISPDFDIPAYIHTKSASSVESLDEEEGLGPNVFSKHTESCRHDDYDDGAARFTITTLPRKNVVPLWAQGGLSRSRSPLENVSNISLFNAMGIEPASNPSSISTISTVTQTSYNSSDHTDIDNALRSVASRPYDHDKDRNVLHVYEGAWDDLLEENERRRIHAIHILNRIGNVQNRLGNYDMALEKFRTSMGLRRDTLGDSTTSLEIIATFQSLGEAHYRNSPFSSEDEFGQALSAYEEVCKEQTRAWGPQHIEVAKTWYKIGDCHRRRDQCAPAAAAYDKALDIFQRADADESLVLDTLRSLAATLADGARHDEALALLEQALDVREGRLGEFHEDLAPLLSDIGLCRWRAGDVKASLEHYLRALHILRHAQGDDSPEVGRTLFSIARLLEQRRDFAAALNFFKGALVIQERHHGPHAEALVPTVRHIGCIFEATRRETRAIQAYKEVYRIQKANAGERGTDSAAEMARTLCKMGGLYEWKRQHQDAYRCYRKALKLFIRSDCGADDADFRRTLEGYFYEEWVTRWKEDHALVSP